MAQNDTHVALIILATQMWGGGGIIGGKNFFGPKFVFLRLRRQHPFLYKTKGPTRNPISPTPPLLRRASMSPPPPPPRRAIFRSPHALRHSCPHSKTLDPSSLLLHAAALCVLRRQGVARGWERVVYTHGSPEGQRGVLYPPPPPPLEISPRPNAVTVPPQRGEGGS